VTNKTDDPRRIYVLDDEANDRGGCPLYIDWESYGKFVQQNHGRQLKEKMNFWEKVRVLIFELFYV